MSEPIIKVTPEEWDAQYRAGQWDYLKDVTAHYAVIASLVNKYDCASLIDVGSGAGLLRNFLYPAIHGVYLGIDVSPQAAREANSRLLGTEVCFAEEFSTIHIWDCAVFCESLYYMPDPLEVLARYFGFCKIIFLSIMISDKTAALIRSIQNLFTVVDDFQLVSATGGGWEIMAVKP